MVSSEKSPFFWKEVGVELHFGHFIALDENPFLVNSIDFISILQSLHKILWLKMSVSIGLFIFQLNINPRKASFMQKHLLARPGEKRCIESMCILSVYTWSKQYINLSHHLRVIKLQNYKIVALIILTSSNGLSLPST